MKHVAAAIVVVVALVAAFVPGTGEDQPQTTGEFATFEKRIRPEVWGKGSEKIRLGDFETTRQALEWMQEAWPRVEGEVFDPLAEEEQKVAKLPPETPGKPFTAEQRAEHEQEALRKLGELWEARSK